MRSVKVMGIVVLGACAALAGSAGAQSKGAGKSSISIIAVPAPSGTTPKTAGSVSSKPVATVVGKPPTGGGSFAVKLAKPVVPPAALKPGFADGNYVLEIEAAGTPAGNLVNDPLAAAFFIELTVAGGKCTILNNPNFNPGSGNCDGPMQPKCGAPEGVGKCSATLWQVVGNVLDVTFNANDPFAGRFRIRDNPTPAGCETGHVLVEGLGLNPPGSTCRDGAVVGVGGVALGDLQ